MAIINCTSCGAQIDSTARFCRACGQPVFASEAQTARMEPYPRMETSPQTGAETYGFNPAVTAPTYGPPVMQAPSTNPLDKAKQKRTLKIILGLVIFLIIAMVGLGIGLTFLAKDRPARTAPPSPPVAGGMSVSSDLIYPGATVNLRVSGDNGEKVIQLRTDDSLDDVVAWYEKKISPTKKAQIPGVGTTLTDGQTAVVITGVGEGTQVIVTQK